MQAVRADFDELINIETDLKTFQTNWHRAVKGGFKDAAMKTIVPEIQRRAVPQKFRFLITAKAGRIGTVIFTTKGYMMYGRILGMHNFGGRLPRPIYPKRARALRTPYGPRGAVKKEAKVPRRDFFDKGIDAGGEAYCRDVGNAVADRLQEVFAT
jgi:hypothetical protein